MRIALFQPDIPQNTGTLLRLAACMDVPVDVIRPCGFPFSHKALKRAGLDYANRADITFHESWTAYLANRGNRRRLVLLTTGAPVVYTDLRYAADDTLLVGSESAGAPHAVHDAAAARVRIPMAPGLRSLNVAVACAMVLGEALRQTRTPPRSTLEDTE